MVAKNWQKSHKFVFVSCLFWWHFFVETWPLVLTSLSGLEHYFYVSNCSLHKPQIHNYYYYSFIEFIFLEKHCQETDKTVKCWIFYFFFCSRFEHLVQSGFISKFLQMQGCGKNFCSKSSQHYLLLHKKINRTTQKLKTISHKE